MRTITTEQMQDMKSFVIDNLSECCREIVEWDTTGILCNGKTRMASDILTDEVFKYDKLTIVSNIIKDQAMKKCIDLSTTPTLKG